MDLSNGFVKAANNRIFELEEALRPFARINIPDNWPEQCVLTWENLSPPDKRKQVGYITYLSEDTDCTGARIKDYRKAREVLYKAWLNSAELA